MGLIIEQVEMTKMEELEKIQSEMLRLTRRMGEILFSTSNVEESLVSELSPTRTMKFKASLLQEQTSAETEQEKAKPLEKKTSKPSPKRVKSEPVEVEPLEEKTSKPSPKRVKAELVEKKPVMKSTNLDIDKIFPENTASKYQPIGRFIAKRLAGEEICGWRAYTGQNKGMICCLPATKNDSGLFRCGEKTCVRNMKCSGDSILEELIEDHSDEKLSDHFSSEEEISFIKMLLESESKTKTGEKKM